MTYGSTTSRTGHLIPAGRLAAELASLFDGWNVPAWPQDARGRSDVDPVLNAWTDDHAFYLEAELPGLALADLNISVLGDELTLQGERKAELEAGTTYHRRERSVGAFRRVLHLPHAIDVDKVEAVLKDGVLTITLPKAESLRPRDIAVKGA